MTRQHAPDSDPLVELLRVHYKRAGYAWSRMAGPDWTPRLGHWSCACGAEGDVHKGQKVTDLHRKHLAREIRRALGVPQPAGE